MEQRQRWHLQPDQATLCRAVADVIVAAANQCIEARGGFSIVLAGGTTPVAVYRLLVDAQTDWRRWHVYFGDERCVPVADSGRNDGMAHRAWLDKVAIPAGQIHPIPAQLGAEAAAESYRGLLAEVGLFDVVLLGLGEDGHTASLFPGHDVGQAPETTVLPVHDAPKPPPDRVSLGAIRLGRSREVLFLVSGEGKREALSRLKHGDAIPAAAITPAAGVDIYTDIAVD